MENSTAQHTGQVQPEPVFPVQADVNQENYSIDIRIWHPSADLQTTISAYLLAGFLLLGGAE